MSFPGPDALGRGVVVEDVRQIPSEFRSVRRVVVDEAAVREPHRVVSELHGHWLTRERVAVVMTPDAARLLKDAPDSDVRPPHLLGAGFEFTHDRLRFLLGANNYDARSGPPKWWWSSIAADAFRAQDPTIRASEQGDINTFRGAAWCDGGPRQPLDPEALGGLPIVHRDAIQLGAMKFDRNGRSAAGLSPDQMAAVEHPVGPSRVIACAGAGKTSTLTARLKYLIGDLGWDPRLVLAVAYNADAAQEMRERMGNTVANIRTLNALGLAVVNGTQGFRRARDLSVASGSQAQLLPARRVLDNEYEVRAILQPLIPDAGQKKMNQDHLVPYLDGLSAIRLALMDPDEAEAKFDAPGLARAFPKFRQAMHDRKVIDFDGQIYEAIVALLGDPVARKQAQLVGRHMHVDEFQDLTPARLLLVRLIAAPTYNVMGVGDDDQTLYGYSGADPKFLIDFDRYFPGGRNYTLGTNYRCPPTVVNMASRLLKHNEERVPKSITAAPGRQTKVDEFVVKPVSDSQATPTALQSMRTWNQAGTEWNDMAVLSRVKAALLPMQVALADADIPCNGPLKENILNEPGAKAAFACLRIAVDPTEIDPTDLKALVSRAHFRISHGELERFTKGNRNLSILQLRKASKMGSSAFEEFVIALDAAIDAARTGVTSDVLRVARQDMGIGAAMDQLDHSRKGGDRPSRSDTLIALEQTAAYRPNPMGFERWLRDMLSKGADQGGVKLSTIHSTKGAEWNKVIVWGADEGLLPHRLAENIDEERRLMHVAMTRSREECVVMVNPLAPSQFFDEMGIDVQRVAAMELSRQQGLDTGSRRPSSKIGQWLGM